MTDEHPPVPTARQSRSGRRRGLGRRTLLLVALLLLAGGVVMVLQARTAYQNLSVAAEQVPSLQAELVGGGASLAPAAEDLAEQGRSAREALDGLQWAALEHVPWLGDDVRSVRAASVALDELASGAMAEVVAARELVDSEGLRVRDGRLDLDQIAAVEPHLVRAEESVNRAADAVADVPTDGLLDPFRDRFTELVEQIEHVDAMTDGATAAVRLAPPMLGGDERREYLVLVLTNAEPRALGGMPGSLLTVAAQDGRLALRGQRPAFSFPEPVLPLTDPELALFGTQLGTYTQNVTATPHFPRTAELARAMWKAETGREVDGVITIDPVLLGMLLDVTGPVRLPDNQLVNLVQLGEGRTLTSENAARVLLNQVYLDIEDPELQNRFFALAAGTIFRELTSRPLDLMALSRVLTHEDADGRALVWSSRRGEQRLLSGLGVSGSLSGVDRGDPVVGVYLHDRSASKIGYYQDLDVRIRRSGCERSPSRRAFVDVTISADTPPGVADLPPYISGVGGDVPAGVTSTSVMLYAPQGAVIRDVRRGTAAGERLPVTTTFHRGLHVAERTVFLHPQEQLKLTYELRLAEPSSDLEVRTTPGPEQGRFSVRLFSCPK